MSINKNKKKQKMEIYRQKTEQNKDFQRNLERLRQLQELREETSLWRSKVEVYIDTKGLPFFYLLGLSDMHIGHEGVDLVALNDYLTYLKDFPVYAIVLGDVADLFAPAKHPHGLIDDIITPDDQVLIAKQFFTNFKDKILCSVQTKSHDGWSKELSGVDVQKFMVEDTGIPLLEGGGTLELKINNIDYRILCFHEIARYNSSLNILNANRRMLELHKDADMVISSHGHIGGQGKFVFREGKPYLIRLGTFKTHDSFGTQRGLVPTPQVFFPTIFLDGRKKNIEVIEDLYTAQELIKSIENWQIRRAVANLGVARRK